MHCSVRRYNLTFSWKDYNSLLPPFSDNNCRVRSYPESFKRMRTKLGYEIDHRVTQSYSTWETHNTHGVFFFLLFLYRTRVTTGVNLDEKNTNINELWATMNTKYEHRILCTNPPTSTSTQQRCGKGGDILRKGQYSIDINTAALGKRGRYFKNGAIQHFQIPSLKQKR